MEMLVFPDLRIRKASSGRKTYKSRILDIINESPHFDNFVNLSRIKEFSFWDLYFRHHNYFIEKNLVFFKTFNLKEEIRASSLADLLYLWTCCFDEQFKSAFDLMAEVQKKFKLRREVPEYAFQLSEEKICEVLDSKSPQVVVNKYSPEIWFKVIEFLDLSEKLNLAKTCRSLYYDIRAKTIGDLLIYHPQLKSDCSFRKKLWIALVPQVIFK